jgi:uncharacterized protein (DUF736 family)
MYDETNRGVLFRDEDKKTDKHPDYTGKLNVDGVDFRLAGWIKTGKSGKKFLSLKVSEPRQQDEVIAEVTDEPISLNDIPF